MDEYVKVLVTGGAGFIGSQILDRLIREVRSVVVLDNLSSGKIENVESWFGNPNFTLIEGDLKNPGHIAEAVQNSHMVFHFSANPEVRVGEIDPNIHFQDNLISTFNLLEAMRKSKSAKIIVFASTSTVYGDAKVLPTPENLGPLVPISTYGASKLGCEALVSSYAHTFGLRALTLRMANVVGSRSGHGVLIDFIEKLRADPSRLEILGDGSQQKSYMHVDDCVSAIMHLTRCFLTNDKQVEIYNVGSPDQIAIKEIAKIVTAEMGLNNVEFVCTGGVQDGRGWRGDVKYMHLSIEKLLKTGWSPRLNSKQACIKAVRELLHRV